MTTKTGASKKTAAATTDTIRVEVKIKGSAPPYTYNFDGKGDPAVHKRGHLWLDDKSSPCTIVFEIKTKNFTFDDPAVTLWPVTLRRSARRRKRLPRGFRHTASTSTSVSIDDANDDGAAFKYTLSVIDPNGDPDSIDPIIVNRGGFIA